MAKAGLKPINHVRGGVRMRCNTKREAWSHLADLGGVAVAGGVQELVGALRILARQRLLHHRAHAQQAGQRLTGRSSRQ